MNFPTFVFISQASNGVVLAAEKKQKSILYDDSTINKVEMVTKSVGMVYSGMGPDYRYMCTVKYPVNRKRCII